MRSHQSAAPHVISQNATLMHELEDFGTGHKIKIWRTDTFMSNRQVITTWATKVYGDKYGEIWYPITQSETPDLVRTPTDLEVATYYKSKSATDES